MLLYHIVLKYIISYNDDGDLMLSIKNNVEDEIIINKSRFICLLIKINNIDNISKYLEDIKIKYKDANHYCYAYVFDNFKKCSDDKEPSGTAGVPMLNVLEKNNLNHILCVIVRYFGGIKLGAGGLVRAYSNSLSKALKKTEIKEIIEAIKVEILFTYDKTKIIDNLLKNIEIKKTFDSNIKYEFTININDYQNIKNTLNDNCLTILEKENVLI